MAILNHSTIDSWLFDYFEGNLSPAQEVELRSFLAANPDLEMDMEAWSNSSVTSEVATYPQQEKLKKERFGFLFWLQTSAAFFLLLLLVGAYSLVTSYNNKKESASTSQLLLNTLNNLALSNQQAQASISNSQYASPTSDAALNQQQKSSTQSPAKTSNQLARTSSYNSHNGKSSNSSANSLRALSDASTQNHTSTNQMLGANKSSFEEKFSSMESIDNEEVKNSFIEKELQTEKPTAHKISPSEVDAKDHWMENLGRKIKNMRNKEVAIHNLRDHTTIVPGLTSRDVNFGNTGGMLATRVQNTSRVQWAGNGAQTVYSQLAADGYSAALHGGIGAQISYSNYANGILQNYEASVTYSPKFKLGKNFVLEPAVRFKMGSVDLNNSKTSNGLQTEWSRGNVQTFTSPAATGTNRLWYKDVGVGILLNAKWFYAGVNLDNIGRHSQNLYSGDVNNLSRTPMNFIATVGTDYESANKKVALSTYLMYQNYGKLNEAWLGANFRYAWFTAGAGVSTGLDPAASVGLKFKNFMLTYSMDYTKNHIVDQRYLSYQLTLRFNMQQSRYARKLAN